MVTPQDFPPLGHLLIASEDGNLYLIPADTLDAFKYVEAPNKPTQAELERAMMIDGRLIRIRAAHHLVKDAADAQVSATNDTGIVGP